MSAENHKPPSLPEGYDLVTFASFPWPVGTVLATGTRAGEAAAIAAPEGSLLKSQADPK